MRLVLLLVFFASINSFGSTNDSLPWVRKEFKNYILQYTPADQDIIESLATYISKGMLDASAFFTLNYKEHPEVFVFPGRESLNSQWRLDWKLPDFNSECWMVASGVAKRLDMLSPLKC